MMKISIAEAQARPGEELPFAFQTTAEELDAQEEDFSFSGEIAIQGALVYTGVCYRVSGIVHARKHFVCDRCLEECEQEQALDFDEEYRQGGDEDGEFISFSGEEIEVTELIRDTLLASQSLSNLCRPDCKGLCPVCGHNLNEGDCGCDRFVPDPRLAALQQLMNKEE